MIEKKRRLVYLAGVCLLALLAVIVLLDTAQARRSWAGHGDFRFKSFDQRICKDGMELIMAYVPNEDDPPISGDITRTFTFIDRSKENPFEFDETFSIPPSEPLPIGARVATHSALVTVTWPIEIRPGEKVFYSFKGHDFDEKVGLVEDCLVAISQSRVPDSFNYSSNYERFPALKVAYIYDSNISDREDFENLARKLNIQLTSLSLSEAEQADLAEFDVLVIGDDTGTLISGFYSYVHWWHGSTALMNNIAISRKKIIGIGYGGTSFFQNFGSSLFSNRYYFLDDFDQVKIADPYAQIWQQPNVIFSHNGIVNLAGNSEIPALFYEYTPHINDKTVTVGQRPDAVSFVSIATESFDDVCLMYWGYRTFDYGRNGQELFQNALFSADCLDTLPVTDSTNQIDVPDNLFIEDINVYMSMDVPVLQDITAILNSPSNRSITLFSHVGDSEAGELKPIFDQESAYSIISGTRPFTQTSFVPQGPGMLSDVYGENALGTWTLTIINDNPTHDIGSISWSLDFLGISLDGDRIYQRYLPYLSAINSPKS